MKLYRLETFDEKTTDSGLDIEVSKCELVLWNTVLTILVAYINLKIHLLGNVCMVEHVPVSLVHR